MDTVVVVTLIVGYTELALALLFLCIAIHFRSKMGENFLVFMVILFLTFLARSSLTFNEACDKAKVEQKAIDTEKKE